MGRLLQAALLVVGMVGVASAGPTRKVKVDSSPKGAKVYIETIDSEPACDQTPCTFDAPVGEINLIIRLDKYEVEFYPLEVTRGKRPMTVSIKLKAAMGMVRIVDAPKGAVVKIEGEEKGKVGKGPLEIPVAAGPVTVTITHNGKTQTEMVEVNAGADAEIEYTGAGASPTPKEVATGGNGDGTTEADGEGDGEGNGDDSGDGDGDGGGDGDTDTPTDGPSDGGEVGAATDTVPEPFVEAGLAMDIGFRRFQYSDGTNPFNNGGEVVIGPALEFWPGRLLDVKPLRGLSLYARVQFGVRGQQVTREDMNMMIVPVGAETLSGALEVSLRQKFRFGPGGVVGAEVSVGYVRDQLEFNADNPTAYAMVPSADYKSIRIGARLSYVAKFEPFIGAENRVVLDGGPLADRADKADPSGYGIRLGLRTKLGPLGARAEFAYSKYSWSFSNTSSPEVPPPGAEDTVMWLGFMLGYSH